VGLLGNYGHKHIQYEDGVTPAVSATAALLAVAASQIDNGGRQWSTQRARI